MSKPAHAATRDLARALRRQTVRVGSNTPAVRGAQWRTATIATVNNDGTIVTDDGITARRLESYQAPAVGDIIALTSTGTGSWLVLGRTAPAGGGGYGFVTEQTLITSPTFAATETAIITTSSVTWRNLRAYRVSIWGLLSAATTANYALLKLRRGTVAGAIWKDSMRIASLPAVTSPGAVSLQPILTNTSGADITAALCLTGIQGTTAQTWTWTANAANVSHLLVEDIGPTSLYSGQPIT